MDRLKGKIAFITGAGAGIAKASAILFAREGAKVVVAELNEELGKLTEREIRSAGQDATFVQTDVTNEESIKSAIAKTVGTYGKLNVLFNCVGTSAADDDNVDVVDMKLWQPTMSMNLLSAFLGCRHGIPELKKAGGGAVINMASWVAVRGYSPQHIYSSSKGAIISLTRSLAGAYALDGIRANAIAPGVVRTERSKARYENAAWDLAAKPSTKAQVRVELAKQYPFSVGEPEDIANIALFLASDESRTITGSTIMADGGRTEY
jgi:NAD(P)-dependent dehydrogenase (short-subunit alcohol dehydrogenase family)